MSTLTKPQVFVFGRDEVTPDLLAQLPLGTKWISITEPDERPPAPLAGLPDGSVLHLQFYDSLPGLSDKPPRPAHVMEAVKFARANAEFNIAVHCAAGISRSSATAITITMDREQIGVAQAYSHHVAARKIVTPNISILLMGHVILRRSITEVAEFTSFPGLDVKYQRIGFPAGFNKDYCAQAVLDVEALLNKR